MDDLAPRQNKAKTVLSKIKNKKDLPGSYSTDKRYNRKNRYGLTGDNGFDETVEM
jgi:hypothetical protein